MRGVGACYNMPCMYYIRHARPDPIETYGEMDGCAVTAASTWSASVAKETHQNDDARRRRAEAHNIRSHLGTQDDVLGRGRSVPLEAVAFPLPFELVRIGDAETERVLVVDGNDVGQGPRRASRPVDLVGHRCVKKRKDTRIRRRGGGQSVSCGKGGRSSKRWPRMLPELRRR